LKKGQLRAVAIGEGEGHRGQAHRYSLATRKDAGGTYEKAPPG
jgi:hypothetical protein